MCDYSLKIYHFVIVWMLICFVRTMNIHAFSISKIFHPKLTNVKFYQNTHICRMSSTISNIPRLKIKKIIDSPNELESSFLSQQIVIKGWVRTIRAQKKFSFIEVNDGSSIINMQVIAEDSIASYDQVEKLTTGASCEIIGTIIPSLGKNQKYELKAAEVKLIGDCSAETYPLQKKRHSQEFLRSIAHLRARTNTISAVSRVRSALAFATHEYFQSQGFYYLQSPLITASDCEGAGEMFQVTTLPLDNIQKIPLNKQNETDFTQEFFGKPAFLTVSGQLSGETYACALGDIYTFGPTFRAENSQTTKHLAEFHMIEPEMAFCNLFEAMDNAEDYVRYVVKYVLQSCQSDMAFFNKFVDTNILTKLDHLVTKPFARVEYREAIRLLQEEIAKDPSIWQFPHVEFGTGKLFYLINKLIIID